MVLCRAIGASQTTSETVLLLLASGNLGSFSYDCFGTTPNAITPAIPLCTAKSHTAVMSSESPSVLLAHACHAS
ncbi:hypothetical protein CIB48_g1190 [Xylaria polymorpha]|nr:hypothetical protein CIB48_g1190 [Xylaria polymorpha]